MLNRNAASHIIYHILLHIYTQMKAIRVSSRPTKPPEILFAEESGAVVEVAIDVLPELVVWVVLVVSV